MPGVFFYSDVGVFFYSDMGVAFSYTLTCAVPSQLILDEVRVNIASVPEDAVACSIPA